MENSSDTLKYDVPDYIYKAMIGTLGSLPFTQRVMLPSDEPSVLAVVEWAMLVRSRIQDRGLRTGTG